MKPLHRARPSVPGGSGNRPAGDPTREGFFGGLRPERDSRTDRRPRGSRASTAPLILGIDATASGGACLLRGSRVLVGIKEERLSRVEGASILASLPSLALRYCQEAAGIDMSDIDLVACRSDGTPDRWPHDVTLNPQLRIPRNGMDWITISADREARHAPADSGISVALDGLQQISRESRFPSSAIRARGRIYDADEVFAAAKATPGLTHRVPPGSTAEAIADYLCAGRAVGWFQGPSNSGDDAGTARMLLCGPDSPASRRGADLILAPAKGQQRPFDVLMTVEDVESWCEAPAQRAEASHAAQLMRFSPARRQVLPAALQGPDTCSVRVVPPEEARLHALLESVGERTGRPFVYGASFRALGEPVVETPTDALWSVLHLDLVACALGDSLVERRDPSASMLDMVPTVSDRACVVSGDCRQDTVDDTVTRKLVSVEVTTPWGPTTRTIDALQLALLRDVDGETDGWALLERVNGRRRTQLTQDWLLHALAELRRLGIITLDAADGAGEGSRTR